MPPSPPPDRSPEPKLRLPSPSRKQANNEGVPCRWRITWQDGRVHEVESALYYRKNHSMDGAPASLTFYGPRDIVVENLSGEKVWTIVRMGPES